MSSPYDIWMKNRRLLPKMGLLLMTLCLLAGEAAAQSGPPWILLDGSGSMRGFVETGQMAELHRALRGQPGQDSRSFYFIDLNLMAVDGDAGDPPGGYGGTTYLTSALKKALDTRPQPRFVWLVTDNQPSAPNESASNTDITDLYRVIRSEQVKRIYLFPLKLSFKGTLFKGDGFSHLADNYEGLRGLLVYALLLDEGAADDFEGAVEGFGERFKRAFGGDNFQRFSIRSPQKNTVAATIISGDKLKYEKGRIIGRDFAEGQPIAGSFSIELTSQFEKIRIDAAKVSASQVGDFETNDFSESRLRPQIDPPTLKEFRPGDRARFTVSLSLDSGVHLKKNPVSLWKSVMQGRGDVEGKIQISIAVPPGGYSPIEDAVRDFSTDRDVYLYTDQKTQSRIYRLTDLVKSLVPQEENLLRPRIEGSADGIIPIHLSVRYPAWPTMVILIAFLLPLGLIAAVVLWARQQPLYRLTWDEGRSRACPDFRLLPFFSKPITIDDREAAAIKRSLSGLRVTAMRGYTVDEAPYKNISPRGVDFNISRRGDGLGINFYFAGAFRAGRPAANPLEDIFGEESYGRRADDDLGAGSAKLPVRTPRTADGAVPRPSNDSTDGDGVDLDSIFR